MWKEATVPKYMLGGTENHEKTSARTTNINFRTYQIQSRSTNYSTTTFSLCGMTEYRFKLRSSGLLWHVVL